MALIKCPDCGKAISEMAQACINCGCPVNYKPSFSAGQTVFVLSVDGCYYPAIIDEVDGKNIKITLFNGNTVDGEAEWMMSIDEAFKNLDFITNEKNPEISLIGEIVSSQPLILSYYDGGHEQVELEQLIGIDFKKSKKNNSDAQEKPASGCSMAIAGIIITVLLYFLWSWLASRWGLS